MSQEDELINEQTVEESAAEAQRCASSLPRPRPRPPSISTVGARATADLSNARERMQRELEEYRAAAAERVLEKLLPVADDVHRAFENIPPDLADDDWVNGFRMIQRKLDQLLESESVSVILTAGQSFDPELHFAVSHEEAEGYEEGQIIGEVAQGYRLNDKVLRASMVRVAKGT